MFVTIFILAVLIVLALANIDTLVSYHYHYTQKIKQWYRKSKEYDYFPR